MPSKEEEVAIAVPDVSHARKRWQAKPTAESMEDFDKMWAALLKKVDELEGHKRTLLDARAEAYVEIALGHTPNTSLDELDLKLGAIQRDLEPLLQTRAQEGAIRQRITTQAAAARFEEIIGERRAVEKSVRDLLSGMRGKAKALAADEAKLRDLTEQDATLQNEQIGCNDRGLLNRHVEGSLRGIGGGNATQLLNQIEQDLISVAHRAGS